MLKKIISGGQTGADRGGLDAALELGLEPGGTAPLLYKAEDGVIPDRYKQYLKESRSSFYPERTKKNVQDSDATLIFANTKDGISKGSELTKNICLDEGKPWALLNIGESFLEEYHIDFIKTFLKENNVETLNVAGNRESKLKGCQETVKRILINAIR